MLLKDHLYIYNCCGTCFFSFFKRSDDHSSFSEHFVSVFQSCVCALQHQEKSGHIFLRVPLSSWYRSWLNNSQYTQWIPHRWFDQPKEGTRSSTGHPWLPESSDAVSRATPGLFELTYTGLGSFLTTLYLSELCLLLLSIRTKSSQLRLTCGFITVGWATGC